MKMKSLLTAAGLSAIAAWAAAAEPTTASAPTRRELHAAECVAALEAETEGLAAQVKGGDESLRPLLQSRLESGTAFVGDVYLHDGTDEAKARALANAALEAQKSLSTAQLAGRQASCADEGAKLLAASNGLERAIVQRLARRRMTRLLAG